MRRFVVAAIAAIVATVSMPAQAETVVVTADRMVDVLEGPHAGRYLGAASIGVRPMFGENAPNLEVHLLDFDGDLYGAELSVALVAWLRPELKFEGVEPLVAQMRDDVAEARARLAGAVR